MESVSSSHRLRQWTHKANGLLSVHHIPFWKHELHLLVLLHCLMHFQRICITLANDHSLCSRFSVMTDTNSKTQSLCVKKIALYKPPEINIIFSNTQSISTSKYPDGITNALRIAN